MKKIALAAFVIVALMLPMTAVADKTISNEQVAADDWYFDNLSGLGKDDNLKVDFTSDKPIDVYIFSSNSYYGPYKNNTNFIATYQLLNTTGSKFSWVCPDDQTYFLIFDNRANTYINGSANPNGAATLTYTRSDPLEEALNNAVTAISTFCIGVIAVIVIIFIVVVIVVWLVRRKNKPVQAPPGSANVMYGAPAQQPYQPMPGQYPQQPGQYMPPPPPPGGPGVPPPPGQ